MNHKISLIFDNIHLKNNKKKLNKSFDFKNFKEKQKQNDFYKDNIKYIINKHLNKRKIIRKKIERNNKVENKISSNTKKLTHRNEIKIKSIIKKKKNSENKRVKFKIKLRNNDKEIIISNNLKNKLNKKTNIKNNLKNDHFEINNEIVFNCLKNKINYIKNKEKWIKIKLNKLNFNYELSNINKNKITIFFEIKIIDILKKQKIEDYLNFLSTNFNLFCFSFLSLELIKKKYSNIINKFINIISNKYILKINNKINLKLFHIFKNIKKNNFIIIDICCSNPFYLKNIIILSNGLINNPIKSLMNYLNYLKNAFNNTDENIISLNKKNILSFY